jgi:hypothetical protein
MTNLLMAFACGAAMVVIAISVSTRCKAPLRGQRFSWLLGQLHANALGWLPGFVH